MDLAATASLAEYSTIRLARRFRLATLLFAGGSVILAASMFVDAAVLPAIVWLLAAGALLVAAAVGIEPATLVVRPDGLVITTGGRTEVLAWDQMVAIEPRRPALNRLPVVTTCDGQNLMLKALRGQPAAVAQGLERLRLDAPVVDHGTVIMGPTWTPPA